VSWLELKIPPLVVTGLFAGAALLSSRFVPIAQISFPGHRQVATALLALGGLVAGIGVIEFRRARTTVDPRFPERTTAVVASGIYRVTRNPMYAGFAVALLGLAVWGGTLVGCLAVPLFVLYMNRFQIEPEERAMLDKFGAEYREYMRRVRRWI
jgi:protein-S-isoprenylcysteine O-methyltransferase Ste14